MLIVHQPERTRNGTEIAVLVSENRECLYLAAIAISGSTIAQLSNEG
jgi:hypothetical protein